MDDLIIGNDHASECLIVQAPVNKVRKVPFSRSYFAVQLIKRISTQLAVHRECPIQRMTDEDYRQHVQAGWSRRPKQVG